jgi:hypothetical protein
MTTQAQQHLDELASTLATLTKLVRDIEPSVCTDSDLAKLQIAGAHLDEAEDVLSALCAENVEAQEDEDSEPEFPYPAWDLIADEPITVLGWTDDRQLRLDSGYTALAHEITTVFPAWYTEAQQREADAKDERETVEDVRYGG